METQQTPDTDTTTNTGGVLLLVVALILGVVTFSQWQEEWVAKIQTVMIVVGPLLIAGAVLLRPSRQG